MPPNMAGNSPAAAWRRRSTTIRCAASARPDGRCWWRRRRKAGTCRRRNAAPRPGIVHHQEERSRARLWRARGEGRVTAGARSRQRHAQGSRRASGSSASGFPASTTRKIVTGQPLFGIDVDGAGHALCRVPEMPGLRRHGDAAPMSTRSRRCRACVTPSSSRRARPTPAAIRKGSVTASPSWRRAGGRRAGRARSSR